MSKNPLFTSVAVLVTLLVWVNLIARIVLLAAAWTADPPYVDQKTAAADAGRLAACRRGASAADDGAGVHAGLQPIAGVQLRQPRGQDRRAVRGWPPARRSSPSRSMPGSPAACAAAMRSAASVMRTSTWSSTACGSRSP